MKTVNQLLDIIDDLTIDETTTEIGEIRQKLINIKREHTKGGLRTIENTASIIKKIASAKLNYENAMLVHAI